MENATKIAEFERQMELSRENQSYTAGYKQGYAEAMMKLGDILAIAQNPKIIVTTQENLERIKKEYNI
mgnify:CR=1 FL=1